LQQAHLFVGDGEIAEVFAWDSVKLSDIEADERTPRAKVVSITGCGLSRATSFRRASVRRGLIKGGNWVGCSAIFHDDGFLV
jgi:hypothetical protein